ncbi:UDP-N-acetylmuramate dehydrogenase [Ferriphaselus sp. R-1]|uniref:UDP-N-acetylmuramate dehydrogenase n=1 Tax=Ferriphaselus sp. R-1 TaxID=1485544 RepID=UPI001EFF732E|nr:UDP-N-acetylmuramate dehydrogenase [Ferriphaselus sp. R-1]
MSEPTNFLRGELSLDVDMSRHVSWRAGGRVARMYQAVDLADLALFLRTLPQDEPLLTVGLGSNLLVRDGGLRGTLLLTHGALTELHQEADGLLYAQAGVPGAKLARFAATHDLIGAEFCAGIPGTVGGMLAMNAGCYGSEIWDKVARVQVLTRAGELVERTPADYAIGYRSVQRRDDDGEPFPLPTDELFVGVWLKFESGDGAASRLAIKTLLEKRVASQPIGTPNAGSVFRNPAGDHAARLIESCGLKGCKIGGAEVSQKHANFIVNTGGATAADIEGLIERVQAEVAARTGIHLHPEIRIIGEKQ